MLVEKVSVLTDWIEDIVFPSHDQESYPAPLTGNFDAGIAWSTTPVLDVVESSGPGLTVNTISSIQSVNTVTFSTLASINTVS